MPGTLYAFVVPAELWGLGVKKLFILIRLHKTHLYQYKRPYIGLQFSLLCIAQAVVLLQEPSGHRRVGDRCKGSAATLVLSSLLEVKGENVLFSILGGDETGRKLVLCIC